MKINIQYHSTSNYCNTSMLLFIFTGLHQSSANLKISYIVYYQFIINIYFSFVDILYIIDRVLTFMRVDRFKYAHKNANKICKICE